MTIVSISVRPDGAASLYCLRSSPRYEAFSRLAQRYAWLDRPTGYACPFTTLSRLVPLFRAVGLTIRWGDGALAKSAESYHPPTAPHQAFWDLYPYQREGAEWLARRSTGLLADEMGLGKTVQTLSAVNRAVLIVCPGVAKGVWERETRRWRKDLAPVVLQGKGSFRFPEVYDDPPVPWDPRPAGEVVITNYDVLPSELPDVPLYVDLVFDEAHALKNPAAKRTKLARALSEKVRIAHGRVWLLTATPMLNHGGELWEVLEAAGLAREAFQNWTTYCRVMGAERSFVGKSRKPVRTWGVPTKDAAVMLKNVCLRRMRRDVLPDLPGKTHQDIPVSLSKKDLSAVEALLRELEKVGWSVDRIVSYLDKGNRPDGKIPFSLLTRLRSVLAMAKMGAMSEIVESYEDAKEPLVVFSAHRTPIDLLARREGWETITGDVPMGDRSKLEDRFQAGELKGLAGTIKAMGVAVTLTRAAHSLFVDHEWTPSINQQAEDRMSRIGQTRVCMIRHLVADHPVDIRVAEVLRRKTEAIGRIL